MRRFGLLIYSLLALGCEDDDSSKQGELGNVTFTYVCSGADYQCAGRSRGLPEAIAVGGEFKLEEDEAFSTTEHLRASAPSMVSKESSSFRWHRPGFAAILVFEPGGEIEDFTHFKGLPVDRLFIEDENENALRDVALRDGRSIELFVRPESSDGIPLGGGLPYEWTSADETIVRVSGSNPARLTPLGEGETKVQVEFNGIAISVDVEVFPSPNIRPRDAGKPPLGDAGLDQFDASAPLTDASIDAGSDAGSAADAGEPPDAAAARDGGAP